MTDRDESVTRPDPNSGSPAPCVASGCWRIVLDRRTLPLPLLRPVTIGSDARNTLQLTHGSVRPFHAELRRKGVGLQLRLLDETGELSVAGTPTRGTLLTGGEEVRIGDLPIRVEKGEIAAAVAVTAAAPLSLEQEFLRAFTRELKRTPWFAVSVAVHVLLLLWAQSYFEQKKREERNLVVHADVDDISDAMPLVQEESDPDTPPEPPPDVEELPEIEPLDDPEQDDLHYLEDDPITSVGVGNLRNLGIGQGSAFSAGFGGRGVSLSGAEGPLRGRLEKFRESGVDVVFLIDTTASMESFLRAAKATIDRIITDLADLVPNARLGIVAYRDEGDEYVTLATPISTDRYAILNFLESLRCGGGGDVPEGVLDAFEYAFDELRWRRNAHRVVLLVADAPPHAEDMSKLRMRLKSAARSTRTPMTVSSIFTGRGVVSHSRQ
ncbi:MAG: VWA domain-containing protein, partial [Planctomycetota bacterium JB042]